MNTISPKDVREIVQEENSHIKETMIRVADSIEKNTDCIKEITGLCKVYEERSINTNKRIDEVNSSLNEMNKSVIAITMGRLPELEAVVAVNSFSSAKMWKIAFAITLPLIVGAWGVLERFNSLQADQMKIMVEAIKGKH